MLILILTFASAFKSPLYQPSSSIPQINLAEPLFTLPSKAKTSVTGGSDSCYLTTLSIQSKNFVVRLDTGSSDTALPHTSLAGYSGPTLSFPIGNEKASSRYGDGSSWTGFIVRTETGLNGTFGVAPIAVMTSQSVNPPFETGNDGINGLFGVGFPSIASAGSNPKTVVQSWFDNRVIAKNEIAVHGCPYTREEESWIDVGNETPYSDCGNYSVSIGIPFPGHYNLDVLAIYVNFKAVKLPGFQKSGNEKVYSIMDSCTSLIVVPDAVLDVLHNSIINSGGLSTRFANDVNLQNWLDAKLKVQLSESDFNWDLLPTIAFTIGSQDVSFRNITVVLGPKDYIQLDSTGNFWKFLVIGGDSALGVNFAILGLPMYSAFHTVVDLRNSRLTFQPGCGCANNTSIYPQMFKDYKGLCPGNCVPPKSAQFPQGNRNSAECKCQNSSFIAEDLPKQSKSLKSSPNLIFVFVLMLLWV